MSGRAKPSNGASAGIRPPRSPGCCWRADWSDQNILDLPEEQRPELINDRGRQMKAKPIQRLCEDHGMPQLFARPRTPNDNPFIESAFSTVNARRNIPAAFWTTARPSPTSKNTLTGTTTEHYHSGIDYVTPERLPADSP